MGLFRLPSSTPSARKTVGSGQRYREVTTPTELRAAIAAAATVSQTAGVDAVRGMKIAIAAPMKFDEPVEIPIAAVGLEVTSLGSMAITADGLVSSLFVVRAPFVVLRGLFVPVPDDVNNRFATFVAPGLWEVGLAPFDVTIDDNYVAADALYLDAAPSFIPLNWHVTRNRFVMGADTNAAIDGNCERWLISGNTFDGCTTTVLLDGASSANRINGNDHGNGAVDTSGSSGFNSIIGNTSLGASAFHVDDVELNP